MQKSTEKNKIRHNYSLYLIKDDSIYVTELDWPIYCGGSGILHQVCLFLSGDF